MGNAKTLTYMSYGVATAFDQMREGKWLEAEDTLAKLLVASEQAAIDASDFLLAWLLTFLPEPPWARMRAQSSNETQGFAHLSDPAWVAASIAYMKDIAALQELRRRPQKQDPKAKDGKDTKKD